MRRPRRTAGFTLIEMLAVVVMTSLVLTAAARFYLQLSRATVSQTEATREARRATLLVDRVARDLQGAVLLIKPAGADPLNHPWLFFAESRNSDTGADRLKFMTYGHEPRASALHESDLATVTYALAPTEGDGFDLLRSAMPRLPEQLDREIPRSDDDGVQVVGRNLADFGVRLLDEQGNWVYQWDSSVLERSSELPIAAEITVALLPDAPDENPEPYVRQVILPVRPFDLESEIERLSEAAARTDQDDEDENAEDEDCVTVAACIERNPDVFALLVQTNPEIEAVVDSIRDQCFSTHADALPVAVQGCE